MAEAGVADYELVNWFGVFLPSGSPEPVVRRLAELINAITASSAAQDFYAKVGGEPLSGSPEDLRKLIASDTPAWGKLVKAAGIEPE